MRLITKASGEKEPFDTEKFRRSLLRSGASEKTIKKLTRDIERKTDLATTFEVYRYALDYLAAQRSGAAVRYNLKNALFQLGPSGFPFEKFVAKLFSQQGYAVRTDQVIIGACSSYEIDLIMDKENVRYFVECKFHGRQGRKADIQVTLYSKARFDDIQAYHKKNSEMAQKSYQAWVVTNTKFTSKAIEYADCVGMTVIDWSYPANKNLAFLIDSLDAHPITALTTISSRQKRMLIEKGLVLCKDLDLHRYALQGIGLSHMETLRVLAEVENI